MRTIKMFIALSAMLYFILAVGSASFDPANWGGDAREVWVLFEVVGLIFTLIYNHVEHGDF
jgi:hypothetical protein